MRNIQVSPLVLSMLAAPGFLGCGTPMQNCGAITITVSPATATLDHTVAGNSQTYTQDVSVPHGCPLPPLPAPRWSVSNTIAASITESGVASCKAAATSPITVSSGFGTPATLICK